MNGSCAGGRRPAWAASTQSNGAHSTDHPAAQAGVVPGRGPRAGRVLVADDEVVALSRGRGATRSCTGPSTGAAGSGTSGAARGTSAADEVGGRDGARRHEVLRRGSETSDGVVGVEHRHAGEGGPHPPGSPGRSAVSPCRPDQAGLTRLRSPSADAAPPARERQRRKCAGRRRVPRARETLFGMERAPRRHPVGYDATSTTRCCCATSTVSSGPRTPPRDARRPPTPRPSVGPPPG